MFGASAEHDLALLLEAFDGTWAFALESGACRLAPMLANLLGKGTTVPLEDLAAGVDAETRARVLAGFEANAKSGLFGGTLTTRGADGAPLVLRYEGFVLESAGSAHRRAVGTHAVVLEQVEQDPNEPLVPVSAYGLVVDRDAIVQRYVYTVGAPHNAPPAKIVGSCVLDSLRHESEAQRSTRQRITDAIDHGIVSYHEAAFPMHGDVRTIAAKTMRVGPGQCVIVARDVTEIHRAQKRRATVLYEAERITAAVPGCVYRYRRWPDGVDSFLFASEGCREIFGVSPRELIDSPAIGWNAIHPEDQGAFLAKTLASMETLDPFVMEYRVVATGKVRWIRATSNPERNHDGAVTWTGVMQDVTSLKEAEAQTKAMELQMLRAQKLESLGLLAGGIAHDFNNLLVGVLGNTGMLMEELPAGTDLRALAEQIDQAARRMAAMTRQMLAYSGRSKMTMDRSDLNQAVDEVMSLVRAAVSKSVALKVAKSPERIFVEMESNQVTQVVMNLVINGAEAIGERSGSVVVETSVGLAGPEDFRDTPWADELPAGRYACIAVRDDGDGMDAATKARIFDPFFSTKFTGRGLGLAAVLGIVKSHRGALRVDSEPGKGTLFRVYFPGLDGNAEASAGPVVAAAPIPSGRVLVVDDEAIVRTAAVRVLQQDGLEVVAVESGRRAIEMVEARGDSLDAVLLDATMPGMGGAEAFRALRAIQPKLAVVFMSGYSEQEIEATTGGGAAGFLAKPFTPRELREKIAAALRWTAAARSGASGG